MVKIKLTATCCLLLLNLWVTNGAGQKSVRYPRDAADLITVVEAFSKADFSVKDAIHNFGTVNRANYHGEDGSFLLTLSPSSQPMIKRVVLDIFASKPDRVRIEYAQPVLISYGALKEKFGSPGYLKPPVYKCKPGVKCQPAFVGYSFSFVPDQENMTSGKRLGVVVDLKMESSKTVPQHTDQDFLAVKEILFRRVWREK
jgi:hypothetical protein